METKTITGIPTLDPKVSAELIFWDYGWQQDMAEGAINVAMDVTGRRTVSIDAKTMAINTILFGVYQCEALGIKKPLNDDGLNVNEVAERKKIVRRLKPTIAQFLSAEVKTYNDTYDETEVESEKKE